MSSLVCFEKIQNIKDNQKNGQDATQEASTPATASQLTTARPFIASFAATVKGFYNSRCLSSHTSINLQMHSGCRNNEVLTACCIGKLCCQEVDAVGEVLKCAAAVCAKGRTSHMEPGRQLTGHINYCIYPSLTGTKRKKSSPKAFCCVYLGIYNTIYREI